MWDKLLQQFKVLLRREPREFSFEPVTHNLDSSPVLPQGLMSSIAPAYEDKMAMEREEKDQKESQK